MGRWIGAVCGLGLLAFAMAITAPLPQAQAAGLRFNDVGCVADARVGVRLPARTRHLSSARFSLVGRRVDALVRGRRAKVVRGAALRSRIVLIGVRPGSRLRVVARTRGGRSLKASKRLRACRARPDLPSKSGPASKPPTGASGLAVPAGEWPAWQYDVHGSRFNPTESKITPASVAGLELKWSFVFPNVTDAASSQVAVSGGLAYVGGRNGVMYALDARTGRTRWSFDTAEVVGDSSGNGLRNGASVADGLVYFGDSSGFVYALDATSGKLRWATEVDDYPTALLTGSPLLHEGRLYSGVSSGEVFTGGVNPAGECCSFRGSFVSLDAKTGKLLWRYWTVEEPKRNGSNSYGGARFEPSGVAVWNTPSIDPRTKTVFFGTSQNYTGATSRADAMIALDAATGREKWARQMTFPDAWTVQCLSPIPGGNCPDPGPDHDFGSSPNVFELDGRTVVGQGQKSGVYHLLDAATGNILWQRTLSDAKGPGGPGGQTGIQWGSSFDGQRLYVATNNANPGTLFALDPRTGKTIWATLSPEDGCTTGGAASTRPGDCVRALPAAVSTIPGLVFEGGRDGKMRAFASDTGKIVWEYDTVRTYQGVNGGLPGQGGSISGAGATVAGGMVYVNSGYTTANSPLTGIAGNVLLAFGPKEAIAR